MMRKPYSEVVLDSGAVRREAKANQNALRHGLNTISRRNPAFLDDICEIADAIAGDELNDFTYSKAVAFAECEVLLAEIRRYRSFLVKRLLDPEALPTTCATTERKTRVQRLENYFKETDELNALHPPRGSPPAESPEFNRRLIAHLKVEEDRTPEAASALALPDLMRLHRYERRAWSARKRAFFEFLAAIGGYSSALA